MRTTVVMMTTTGDAGGDDDDDGGASIDGSVHSIANSSSSSHVPHILAPVFLFQARRSWAPAQSALVLVAALALSQ